MNALFPPPPLPSKVVTLVRGLCPLQLNELLPPWGGPAEAVHGR